MNELALKELLTNNRINYYVLLKMVMISISDKGQNYLDNVTHYYKLLRQRQELTYPKTSLAKELFLFSSK